MNSILNYPSANDYFIYLDSLESGALLNEFYACHRLKKAITARTNRICREVYNVYRPLFVEYDAEDITNYRHYLIRVLLNFEKFVKQQRRHINKLRDLYDPRPMRSIKPPEVFDACSVLRDYDEVVREFQRLEGLVSAFENANNKSLSSAHETSILEYDPAEKGRDKFHSVKLNDNDECFKNALKSAYEELAWIVLLQMGCDISVFKDKRKQN